LSLKINPATILHKEDKNNTCSKDCQSYVCQFRCKGNVPAESVNATAIALTLSKQHLNRQFPPHSTGVLISS